MEKDQPLADIKAQFLTPRDAISLWLDDKTQYNINAIKHNALVDHINKFCSIKAIK